jgi:mannose-1-phosphate guanylyltransferase
MRLRELTALIAGRPIPKQYCRIDGEQSLLEATLERIAPLVPSDRTLAIVNRDHLGLAREQLGGLPTDNVLVQPENRDTGPGLLFSLLHLARRDPDATLAVFPSDHYVASDRAFLAAVARALEVVARQPERLVLLGIRPDRAETGYGYIEARIPADHGPGGAFRVRRFREKPSAEQARALVAAGALWNAFVMVFRVRRVLELLAERRPADFVALACLGDAVALTRGYATLRPWNFSSDFLAHIADELVVVEADGTGWTDWGTRESIERTLAARGLVPVWQRRGAAADATAARFGLYL